MISKKVIKYQTVHNEFQENCDKSRSQLEANPASKLTNQFKIIEAQIRKRHPLCDKTSQNSQVQGVQNTHRNHKESS